MESCELEDLVSMYGCVLFGENCSCRQERRKFCLDVVAFGATGLSLYTAGVNALISIQREPTLSFREKFPQEGGSVVDSIRGNSNTASLES